MSAQKAAKEEALATEASETPKVDEFMNGLKHPMWDVAQCLREVLLSAGKGVGEKIAWNAPSFFYTGKMKPFKPKEYKRYIAVFNFLKKDCLRVIFLKGGHVSDPAGLLEGDYADGRRLAYFKSVEEVKAKEKDLKKIVKELVKLINQS